MNEYSSVPIKLHWQKSMAGHIWHTGHSLSTSAIDTMGKLPTATYKAYWVFKNFVALNRLLFYFLYVNIEEINDQNPKSILGNPD